MINILNYYLFINSNSICRFCFFFDLLYIRQFDCFQVLGSKFEAYQLFFSIILNNKTISFIIIISLTYLDYYFFASNGCCCCCFWFVVHMVCSLYCSLILLFTCTISYPKFHKTPPEMFKQRGDTCHCFVKLVSFKWVLSTRKSNVWSDIPDLFSWKALQASLTDSTW